MVYFVPVGQLMVYRGREEERCNQPPRTPYALFRGQLTANGTSVPFGASLCLQGVY